MRQYLLLAAVAFIAGAVPGDNNNTTSAGNATANVTPPFPALNTSSVAESSTYSSRAFGSLPTSTSTQVITLTMPPATSTVNLTLPTAPNSISSVGRVEVTACLLLWLAVVAWVVL